MDAGCLGFLGAAFESFGGIGDRDPIKPYLLVEELLAPVRWVAMPRAMGTPAFLKRYIPPLGRRKTVPVPPQFHAVEH